MYFVCCKPIPNQELAVLRGRDKVGSVFCPVHSVNLGQVTLEGPPYSHLVILRQIRQVPCECFECSIVHGITVGSNLLLQLFGLPSCGLDPLRNLAL